MKCVVFVKATKNSEAGVMPTTGLITDMMKYNEALVKAGIMQGGDGLKPSAKATRIRFEGKERTVINGPFAETSELVAGYWLWEVKDMAEAIAWAQRCPSPMPGAVSELEIRPVYAPEDFGEAFTPGLQEKYNDLLQQEAKQR